MSRFAFTVAATDGAARTGTIRMRRGEIRTPAFMPGAMRAPYTSKEKLPLPTTETRSLPGELSIAARTAAGRRSAEARPCCPDPGTCASAPVAPR